GSCGIEAESVGHPHDDPASALSHSRARANLAKHARRGSGTVRRRRHGEAEGDSERELPVGRTREASPDTGVEPKMLLVPGLPDEAEERRIVLIRARRLCAMDLADESNAVGDGKLGDQSPDPDQVTGRAFDPEPAVEVEREGAELVAQDADALEPEMPLRFLG